MNVNYMSKTQLRLIKTSGPLFAADGVKGTTIRAITQAAGVNVAGINYHFGSKEKLFSAVGDYVFKHIGYENLGMYWNKLSASERNKMGVLKMFRECLGNTLNNFFRNNYPQWYFIIMHRIIMVSECAIKYFDENMYMEDMIAAEAILKIFNINIKSCDVESWLTIWYGQAINMSILMPWKLHLHKDNNLMVNRYLDTMLESIYIAVTSILERSPRVDSV